MSPDVRVVEMQHRMGRMWARGWRLVLNGDYIRVQPIDMLGSNCQAAFYVPAHEEDIDALCAGLKYMLCGPLGRAALDAAVVGQSTTVGE